MIMKTFISLVFCLVVWQSSYAVVIERTFHNVTENVWTFNDGVNDFTIPVHTNLLVSFEIGAEGVTNLVIYNGESLSVCFVQEANGPVAYIVWDADVFIDNTGEAPPIEIPPSENLTIFMKGFGLVFVIGMFAFFGRMFRKSIPSVSYE